MTRKTLNEEKKFFDFEVIRSSTIDLSNIVISKYI